MLGLPHLDLEARHVDADALDLVEALLVVLVGVLELDDKRRTLTSAQVEVEEAVVLPPDPAGLLVDVVGDIGSLDAQTLDLEVEVGVKVAAERRVALVEREVVAVDDANAIGHERGGGGGEREVVDHHVGFARDKLDAWERDRLDLVDDAWHKHLDRVAHETTRLVAEVVEEVDESLTGSAAKDTLEVDKVEVGTEVLETLCELAQLRVLLETLDKGGNLVEALVKVATQLRELLVGLLAGGVE